MSGAEIKSGVFLHNEPFNNHKPFNIMNEYNVRTRRRSNRGKEWRATGEPFNIMNVRGEGVIVGKSGRPQEQPEVV